MEAVAAVSMEEPVSYGAKDPRRAPAPADGREGARDKTARQPDDADAARRKAEARAEQKRRKKDRKKRELAKQSVEALFQSIDGPLPKKQTRGDGYPDALL